MKSPEEIAQLEMAYRKSRFTVLGHSIFLIACCLFVTFVRRRAGLPVIVTGSVVIVALLVFWRDIMKFLVLRNELIRLRSQRDSS